MKKIAFLAVLLVLTRAGFAQYDPKAYEILEAMSKKYKAIPAFEASISYTLSNESEKINEEVKGKITVKGDKYRLNLKEQEVFNNGTIVWTFMPDENEVNIDNFDASAEDNINPSKIFEMYKKGYKYVYLMDRPEGGVMCEEVDLVPEKKDAKYFKVKLMINKKDKGIQSFTFFEKSGNRYRYTITKFSPNTKIDDSYFNFDVKKYPKITVTDLRSGN